jgi:hypothetical protein
MLRRRLLSVIPVAVLLAALPISASASVEAKPTPPGLVMLEDLGDIVRWEATIDGQPLRVTTRMFDGCLWSCYPTEDGCWVSPCWIDAMTHEDAAEHGVAFVAEMLRHPGFVAVHPRLGSTDFDERLDGWEGIFAGWPHLAELLRQTPRR